MVRIFEHLDPEIFGLICVYYFCRENTDLETNMAIKITEECINCGACEPECPNTAIYEGGREWTWAGGTALTEVAMEDGSTLNAFDKQSPVSPEFYYIVSGKCTECTGFHEEPQCAAVCPVDCCVPDPDYVESKDELMAKKAWLHNETLQG